VSFIGNGAQNVQINLMALLFSLSDLDVSTVSLACVIR
jgi:hypothetical protein